jgi:hypothetical protein
MSDRKLTRENLERGPARERFNHLQHVAGLNEQSKRRVDEALKAALEHVEKKEDLRYGMQGRHVGMALDFLDTRYDGRHKLEDKERKTIETSLKDHFGIKPEQKEAA